MDIDAMTDLVGRMTRAQKEYLIKLDGWDYKSTRPSVSRTLLKDGLLRNYRGPDYVCRTSLGDELKTFILKQDSGLITK
jgi:hypothetical protein